MLHFCGCSEIKYIPTTLSPIHAKPWEPPGPLSQAGTALHEILQHSGTLNPSVVSYVPWVVPWPRRCGCDLLPALHSQLIPSCPTVGKKSAPRTPPCTPSLEVRGATSCRKCLPPPPPPSAHPVNYVNALLALKTSAASLLFLDVAVALCFIPRQQHVCTRSSVQMETEKTFRARNVHACPSVLDVRWRWPTQTVPMPPTRAPPQLSLCAAVPLQLPPPLFPPLPHAARPQAAAWAINNGVRVLIVGCIEIIWNIFPSRADTSLALTLIHVILLLLLLTSPQPSTKKDEDGSPEPRTAKPKKPISIPKAGDVRQRKP